MSDRTFFSYINNKLLFILTLLYIILIVIALYFNQFSSMQYKGNKPVEIDGQWYNNPSVDYQLDEDEDKYRSTKTRWWHLFIKNKVFFYIIFAALGLFSLMIAWLHNIYIFNSKDKDSPDIDGIPNGFFKNIMIITVAGTALIGLLAIMFFLISYTPAPLTFFVNLLNILIVIGIVAIFFEQFSKSLSAAALGILSFIVFTLIGGWITGLIFGIIGSFIGLAIGKSSNKKHASNLRNNFIINVIKFLPCLFINFASWIRKQFNDTGKNTWYLLGIEAILIIARFLLPFLYKVFKKYFMPKGNILLTNPVSLHKEHSLGKFKSRGGDTTKKQFLNYNYALSFWIWIFPQSPSTNQSYNKSTSLVNISDIVKVNFNNNNLEFWAKTTEDAEPPSKLIKLYEYKKFEFQRWNNIIINYYGGTLDIFINRKLMSSTPNIIPLNIDGAATCGTDKGIYGGIKNVVYFENTITQRDINLIDTF